MQPLLFLMEKRQIKVSPSGENIENPISDAPLHAPSDAPSHFVGNEARSESNEGMEKPMAELIQTEEAYIADLHTFIKIYLKQYSSCSKKLDRNVKKIKENKRPATKHWGSCITETSV